MLPRGGRIASAAVLAGVLVLALLALAPARAEAPRGPNDRVIGRMHTQPLTDSSTGLLDYGVMPGGGRSLSHGPDPLHGDIATPSDRSTTVAGRGRALQCLPEGAQHYYEVIYYVPAGKSPSWKFGQVQEFALGAADLMANEALRAPDTNGDLAYRTMLMQTDSECRPVLQYIRGMLSGTDFGSITGDLAYNFGKNDNNLKYIVFAEGYTSYCGQGNVFNDSRKVPDNAHNLYAEYAVINIGCGAGVVLHEVGHNLSAVQLDAPHNNSGPGAGHWHCFDEHDVMCYFEGGGPNMEIQCPDREWWDCGHNDYFNPFPQPGNYLATHFDIANDSFFVDQVDRTAPEIESAAWTDTTPDPAVLPGGYTVSFAGKGGDNWDVTSWTLGWSAPRSWNEDWSCPGGDYGDGVASSAYADAALARTSSLSVAPGFGAFGPGCYQFDATMIDRAGRSSLVSSQVVLVASRADLIASSAGISRR